RWDGEAAETVEADIADFFNFFVQEMNNNRRYRQKLLPEPAAIKFLTQVVLQHIEGKMDIFSGNVRTLRALIERSYERAQYEQANVVGVGQVATAITHFQAQRASVKTTEGKGRGGLFENLLGTLRLNEIEKAAIKEALMRSGNNKSQAAVLLGIHRDTLRKKMKEYRIE
ncbi:MAG: helix-turn-helix domain-containing protein, partial [candidate division WOR-3 bacterium]